MSPENWKIGNWYDSVPLPCAVTWLRWFWFGSKSPECFFQSIFPLFILKADRWADCSTSVTGTAQECLWCSLPILLFHLPVCLSTLCSRENINTFPLCLLAGYQDGQDSHHEDGAAGAAGAGRAARHGRLVTHGQLHRLHRQEVPEERGAFHHPPGLVHPDPILQQLQRLVPREPRGPIPPLHRPRRLRGPLRQLRQLVPGRQLPAPLRLRARGHLQTRRWQLHPAQQEGELRPCCPAPGASGQQRWLEPLSARALPARALRTGRWQPQPRSRWWRVWTGSGLLHCEQEDVCRCARERKTSQRKVKPVCFFAVLLCSSFAYSIMYIQTLWSDEFWNLLARKTTHEWLQNTHEVRKRVRVGSKDPFSDSGPLSSGWI